MNNGALDCPGQNVLEISMFGPGFGECIVLHFGNGKWMIVDSCLHPESGLPASLDYLLQLNVEINKAVTLIVATHWHDDHIRGISGVYNTCQSATFVISGALRVDEFLKLVTLYQRRPVAKSSGIDEFSKVFELLETRKQKGVKFNPPKFAAADKLIFRDQLDIHNDNIPINVYSLSPSDATILQAKLAFQKELPQEDDSRQRINSPSSNLCSTVLWVEIGQHKLLLGADLEQTLDPKTGWTVILDESNVVSGLADIFKVPHHGSENAHHSAVWSHLLIDRPFAILSPFSRGKKSLPSAADVNRIANLTPHAYLTAPAKRKKERWRNRVVKDFVSTMTKNMINVNSGWGHVRLRRSIINISEPWEITLMGDAYQLMPGSNSD